MSVLLADTVITPVNSLPFSGLWQVGCTVVLVVMLLLVLRWLSKRISMPRHRGTPQLQVTGSLVIGQNQRIVILDLPDCRLVIGVTAQQINHLYTLPAGEPADTPPSRTPVTRAFLSQLQTLLAERGK